MKPNSNATRSTRLVLILLTVSTLSILSCQTSPSPDPVPVPTPPPVHLELTWPAFPDPAGVVKLDKATQVVSMPLAYWEAVSRYAIAMERNRKIIQDVEATEDGQR